MFCLLLSLPLNLSFPHPPLALSVISRPCLMNDRQTDGNKDYYKKTAKGKKTKQSKESERWRTDEWFTNCQAYFFFPKYEKQMRRICLSKLPKSANSSSWGIELSLSWLDFTNLFIFHDVGCILLQRQLRIKALGCIIKERRARRSVWDAQRKRRLGLILLDNFWVWNRFPNLKSAFVISSCPNFKHKLYFQKRLAMKRGICHLAVHSNLYLFIRKKKVKLF